MAEPTVGSKAGGGSQGASPGDLSDGAGGGGIPNLPVGNVQQAPKPTAAELGDEGSPEGIKAAAALKATVDAAEAAAKAKEAEGPEKGSDAWHKQFIATGNEHADAAIDVMKEAGVSPIEANAVFQKAIESGDLKDIDWSMLEGKLGKSKTALVKAGVQTFFDTDYKDRLAVVNKAHEIVGSKENWDKVKTWAQTAEKTDPALKAKVDNIRKAVDIGGWVAEQALTELKTMYEAAPNNKGLGTDKIISGDKDGVKAVEGGPLTREQFMKESHKLHDAGVDQYDVRYVQLFQRYQKSR